MNGKVKKNDTRVPLKKAKGFPGNRWNRGDRSSGGERDPGTTPTKKKKRDPYCALRLLEKKRYCTEELEKKYPKKGGKKKIDEGQG